MNVVLYIIGGLFLSSLVAWAGIRLLSRSEIYNFPVLTIKIVTGENHKYIEKKIILRRDVVYEWNDLVKEATGLAEQEDILFAEVIYTLNFDPANDGVPKITGLPTFRSKSDDSGRMWWYHTDSLTSDFE